MVVSQKTGSDKEKVIEVQRVQRKMAHNKLCIAMCLVGKNENTPSRGKQVTGNDLEEAVKKVTTALTTRMAAPEKGTSVTCLGMQSMNVRMQQSQTGKNTAPNDLSRCGYVKVARCTQGCCTGARNTALILSILDSRICDANKDKSNSKAMQTNV